MMITSDRGSDRLAVETSGLVKTFGGQAALDGLDLQVPEGSVYLLAGPNGAGKSTTLKLLLGLLAADAGVARIFDLDPLRDGAAIRANIGYVPEQHDVGYPWMSVGDTLAHYAAVFPTWDGDYADRLAKAFQLRLDRKFGVLSKGQARRVQLVLAMAPRPPLLLLDEPTDGLDPVVRDETLSLLADHIAATPTTVLLSTHRIYEVERLADHIGVLREGRLLAQTPQDRLRTHLLRYRAEIPDGWRTPGELDGVIRRRPGTGREIVWTVWGEQAEVRGILEGTGATVREVTPLTLDEATIALLATRDAP
jgi:ABC-2 type transport system ATP-binding protein